MAFYFYILIVIFFIIQLSFSADRNILLVASDLGNLSLFSKPTYTCQNGYGVFSQPMYGGYFEFSQDSPSTNSANYAVFEVNNLPPHYMREVRIEVFQLKQNNVGVLFKLDSMNSISYSLSVSVAERFNLPCNLKGDSIEQNSDYFYILNYQTTAIPSNPSYSIFSVVDDGEESGKSYINIKEIQYNIQTCDNTCLSCQNDPNQCKSCDTNCSQLSGNSCILNNLSNYVLQEGKCVLSCTLPHFNIGGKCIWIPNCQSVAIGTSQCTQCQTGFVPVQTNNYEAQCQPYCPKDYQNVNGICVDNKQNTPGQYLIQGLYSYIFSYSEINKMQLQLNNFLSGGGLDSKFTRCGNYFLLGGYFSFTKNSQITTQQYTTAFQYVRVSFKWVLIDYNTSTNPINLTFSVIGSSTPSQTLNINGMASKQICGLSVPEYIGDFQQDFLVPSGKVTFQINNQMPIIYSNIPSDSSNDKNNKNQYFGIREFSIYAFNCIQSNCQLCSSLTSNGCTQCIQGYYLDNFVCKPCQSTCLTCSSQNTCQSCYGGATLDSQNQCVCPDKQYWNGTSCVACSNTQCQTCNASNSNQCLTCPINQYLYNGNCLDKCPEQTYPNNLACNLCLPHCQKCTNNSTCMICMPGKYLSIDGTQCLSQCLPGQQQNPDKRQCIQCTDPNCLSCQNDVSQCTQCGNNQNLQGYICKANCDSQYYPLNQICKLCSSNISQCLECTPTTCTKCQNSYYLYQGICYNPCPPGTFSDSKANPPKCTSCLNNNCGTCELPPSQNCLSCISPYYLNGTQCITDCGPTMYSNPQRVCTLCSSTFSGCFSCTINECISCINPTDYLNPITNTCSSTCPNNTFKSTVGSPPKNVCIICNSNCLTCDQNSNNCISCPSNMYLQGNICQIQCNNGYYPNASNVCISCTNNFPNCSKCDSVACKQCLDPYYLVQGLNTCQLQCPPGYAATSAKGSNQCIQCTNNLCMRCDNSNLNSCTSCYPQSSNPYLQGNTCVSSCSSNYYNNNQNQCILCSSTFPGCATCSSNACLSCTNTNQYLDITTNSCVDSCVPPLVGVNTPSKQCVQNCDKIASCIKCTIDISNNQTCQLCSNGAVLDQNQCISHCPQGKYADSQNICQQCNKLFIGCSICTSTTCSQCQNSNEFFDPVAKICTSQCVYGANPSSPFSQCQTCTNLKCKACQTINLNQCTSCDPKSSYPYLQDGNCVEKCSSKYYQNGDQCVLCSTKFPNCSTCTTSNCISCDSNYYLNTDQQTCTLSCPSKQYQTNIGGVNICKNCLNSTCLTCDPTNPLNCLTCDQSSNSKYLENNQCNLSCSATNYADLNNKCQICDSLFQNCQKCTLSQCQLCKNGLYLDLQTNKCSNLCPDFKYTDQSTMSCKLCSQPTQCIQCDAKFPDQCLKCAKPYFLLNKQCISSCPDGTYGDSNQICQPCKLLDENCKLCNPGYCTVCKPNEYYLDLDFKKCLTQCPSGYVKYKDINGIQICKVAYGGATPTLVISNEISRDQDKIIFQAQIIFDEDVFVTNKNWIFSLDNEYPSTNYDINYDLVKVQDHPTVNGVYTLKVFVNIIVKVDSKPFKKLYVNFVNPKNVIDDQLFGLKVYYINGDLPSYSDLVYPKVTGIAQVTSYLVILSHIMLLIGSPFYLLVSFFDILQLSNYLLYLNVQYNTTLYNVLKLLDFANFEIIPNIRDYTSNAPFKFRMEEISTFFFSNIIQSIVIWSLSFILYLIFRLIATKFADHTNSIVDFCKSYSKQYFYQIIVGLGFLTYCDLILAVFLQFYDSKQMNAKTIIGVVVGMLMLLAILFLNCLTFKSTKIKVNDLLQNTNVKKVYGFLYNGLEINRKKAIINLLFLFRKTIVIQQLVFNQDNPINQVYICCLVLGVETTVMLILKPYEAQKEFKLHVFSRMLLIISMIMIINLAINDAIANLSQHGSTIIQILVSVLIIVIYISQVSYLVYRIYIFYKKKNIIPSNIKYI
ncbi:transmembrane protein, putative (macronuclear) [Tetrahymena thermophila SB210]|uniref:Transmembrane protein, putative n=1 Tax=Tetrahymena thermophila (strain SB210) TaxID=312017 RepID=I7M6X5_TETTS|nr:transmembrane protein, putative [Tetrahymena thermophila SB210]EAR87439.2 transmembrane protein, putative [Tetrahymena thermophila SB210]|eukprot:XP_001007684.2 transmembrane protein, putative [Tetrahymena thermophila SB210]